MAPLRSSRSSRHLHHDGGTQGRLRSGNIDHDPMEGLPVRRWELTDVTIKQDAKGEDHDLDGKEGPNPSWPWPDLPMPKDFNLLPSHSQEMLRRARAPNKNPNLAVFNKETGEYERPNLNCGIAVAVNPLGKFSDFNDKLPTSTLGPSTDPKDAEADGMEADDDAESEKPISEESRERTITIKRWVPLPPSVADKKPDPKYLAARRPGLPPLYGHQLATAAISHGTGYEPNISSTLLNQGNAVAGWSTVPTDAAKHAAGSAMPIGPGIPLPTGVAPVQGEVKKRPPPPPPKRRKKGGPRRMRRRTAAAGSAALAAHKAKAPPIGLPDPGAQQSTTLSQQRETGEIVAPTTKPDRQTTDYEISETVIAEGVGDTVADVEMTGVGADGDSSSTSEEEDEGSEEGEHDDGDGSTVPTAAAEVQADPILTIIDASTPKPAVEALLPPSPKVIKLAEAAPAPLPAPLPAPPAPPAPPSALPAPAPTPKLHPLPPLPIALTTASPIRTKTQTLPPPPPGLPAKPPAPVMAMKNEPGLFSGAVADAEKKAESTSKPGSVGPST